MIRWIRSVFASYLRLRAILLLHEIGFASLDITVGARELLPHGFALTLLRSRFA